VIHPGFVAAVRCPPSGPLLLLQALFGKLRRDGEAHQEFRVLAIAAELSEKSLEEQERA